MEQNEEANVINFIKQKQKEKLLPKGRIQVYNVEGASGKYTKFKCKIKSFFRKPYYYIIKEDHKKLTFQEIHTDEWDNFKF